MSPEQSSQTNFKERPDGVTSGSISSCKMRWKYNDLYTTMLQWLDYIKITQLVLINMINQGQVNEVKIQTNYDLTEWHYFPICCWQLLQ